MSLFTALLGWCAISLVLACIWSMACEASTLARHRRGPRDRRATVRRPQPLRFPDCSNPHPLTHPTWQVYARTTAAAWYALEHVA